MLDLSDKEQAIIAAAQRIFALHGYSQARVEDIAQAAGVGKGTVYEYFSSKQAVFEQAVEAGRRQGRALLDPNQGAFGLGQDVYKRQTGGVP